MKRSEAIEIIDEVLYEHELPLLQGISKEILSKLEKAGMLPPSAPLLMKAKYYASGLDMTNYENIEKILNCHEWEPEDEKK